MDIDLSSESRRLVLKVSESDLAGGAATIRASGTGLLGMRERVEAHGGELAIDISPAGGLSLNAWMPCVS